jgi:hypothetical protein
MNRAQICPNAPFYAEIQLLYLCIINKKRKKMKTEKEKTSYNTLPEQIDYLIQEISEIKNILNSCIEKKDNIPKYLNIEETIEYLHGVGFSISKSKLYKMTAECKIPYHKLCNRLYFYPYELQKWLENQIEARNDMNTLSIGREFLKHINCKNNNYDRNKKDI